ncbi:MAG: ribose 5-phosphate isomerase B [Chloroflexi bacterium]|nr:ribose 5-phosphate isomerase B [Chloroflexota bacterium]
MTRIALGSDHAGFRLKREIMERLVEEGYMVEDLGSNDTEPSDYPDHGRKVADAVSGGDFERGVLVCSTGIGMCIAANKVRGIRAALCHNLFTARRSREHNDANVLCLGQDVVDSGAACEIVQVFLNTEFAGGRHEQRVGKIMAMEQPHQSEGGRSWGEY